MNHSRRDFLLVTTLLLVILALAAGVRFYSLGGQSLWSDEGNSAALATRSAVQIARDAARDIHPPLYYLLLHVWTRIFGMTEFALRSLSAVLGVLLVLATADLARRMYGPATGLAAAFIGALAPLQVYYSQEARMYILLAVITAGGFLAFWWFLQRDEATLRAHAEGSDGGWSWLPLRSVALVIIWVLGLYTHYLFPLMIGLMSLLYAIWVWGTRRQGWVLLRLVRWAMLGLIALVCFGPWLPIAYRQATSWPTATAVADARAALYGAIGLLGLGPTGGTRTLPGQVWALVGIACLGAVPWYLLLSPLLSRRAGASPAAETAEAAEAREVEGTTDVSGSMPAFAAQAPVLEERTALAGMPVALAGSAPGATLASPILAGTFDQFSAADMASTPSAASRQGARRHGWGAAGRSTRQPGAHLTAWYWVRWLMPVVWILGPLLLMLGLGLFRDAYLKFLLIASPAFVLLLARGVIGPAYGFDLWAHARPATPGRPAAVHTHDLIGGIWIGAALLLVAGLYIPALGRIYADPHLARDDYRGIVQFIRATQQPGDAILLDAPGQGEVFDYYYQGQLPIYPLPGQRPLNREVTLEQLNQLYTHNKVYALYWATQEADPEGLVEQWLDRNGYKTLDQWHGNVRLAVYVMPEQRPPDEKVESLDLALGPVKLLGYQSWNRNPQAGEVTQAQLQWRADETPGRRYKVFLQLLDPRDQVIAQRDAEPAGESRPTTSWHAGEVIQDNHGLLIPPGTPPGSYRRIVGLYDPETGERLRLPTGEDHIDLSPINVERASTPPSLDALGMLNVQNFDFGSVKLLGYDRYKRGFKHAPETKVTPGDRLHMTFYWQANVRPRADWWFDLTLTDNAGHTVAGLQAPLVGPAYSTMLWETQEIVRGEHDLPLPADLPPGTYRMSLTLLPDTNTPAGVAYLGSVTVEPPGK